jgi:hypothetical protein
MTRNSNSPPDRVVYLTKEQHEFLVRNCDSNIAVGLSSLQHIPAGDTAEKLVVLIEMFKGVKKALEDSEERA